MWENNGIGPPLCATRFAKAGVIMATKVMALEWAQYGIRANCIAPGAVETRLYGAIFRLMPEEQAAEQREQVRQRIPAGLSRRQAATVQRRVPRV